MPCPECDGERRRLTVPEELRTHAPGETDAVVACTTCLRSWPSAEAPETPACDATEISDTLPDDETAAVALVLTVELLRSVARNEATIADLFETAVGAGADPRLTLERVAEDTALDPAVDVGRRLHQYEGLR